MGLPKLTSAGKNFLIGVASISIIAAVFPHKSECLSQVSSDDSLADRLEAERLRHTSADEWRKSGLLTDKDS
jgi:hypothetical protein